MKSFGKWLIRIAVVYALLGAMLGSHLAGSQDYRLVPVHAHILVVGWLSMFAIGIFYCIFSNPGWSRLAKLQAVSMIVGGGTMPIGLMMYTLERNPLTIGLFIVTASILLIAFALFALLVFFDKQAMEQG